MQCNLEFFNAWCCRLSQLYTPLVQQHIALVSGISQPCNSFSELHALFTTCRMCCTSRGTKSVKQGRHPKSVLHYAPKHVPSFSCACMCLNDGCSHKCDTLCWQQVTASVLYNATQLVLTEILHSTYVGREVKLLRQECLCFFACWRWQVVLYLAVSAARGK